MLHRVTLAFSAAALIPLAFAAACGSDATEPNEIASVRVVNASPVTAGRFTPTVYPPSGRHPVRNVPPSAENAASRISPSRCRWPSRSGS